MYVDPSCLLYVRVSRITCTCGCETFFVVVHHVLLKLLGVFFYLCFVCVCDSGSDIVHVHVAGRVFF